MRRHDLMHERPVECSAERRVRELERATYRLCTLTFIADLARCYLALAAFRRFRLPPGPLCALPAAAALPCRRRAALATRRL